MRYLPLCAIVLASTPLALASQGVPPGHPSFEGSWVRVLAEAPRTTAVAASGDAAFQVGDMGSGWGATLSFAHRGNRLILEYPYFSAYDLQAPLHYAFPLDGTEVENDVTIGPDRTVLHSRAAWRGDTLVISTRQSVPSEVAPAGTMAEVRRELSLTAPDSLLIVTTRVGVAGAPTNVVRTLYARQR